MYIVYFMDFDPRVGQFLNHRKFDSKYGAREFAKSVDGTIEKRTAFQ